jgi:hypothetical protein
VNPFNVRYAGGLVELERAEHGDTVAMLFLKPNKGTVEGDSIGLEKD